MANLVRPTSSVDDVIHFEAGTTHESSFSDLDALRKSNNRTRWARTPAPLPAWSRWLHRPDMLIVAYKTTGRSKQAEVLDVAAIDTTGEIRFRALTLPVGGITREAVRIHKLTQERLESEGALAWPEVHSSLLAVLSEAHRLPSVGCGVSHASIATDCGSSRAHDASVDVAGRTNGLLGNLLRRPASIQRRGRARGHRRARCYSGARRLPSCARGYEVGSQSVEKVMSSQTMEDQADAACPRAGETKACPSRCLIGSFSYET